MADGAFGTEEEPEENRVRVRMPVPVAVRAAFDEALDLHRAVSGQEASLASFVEALVAEACAGPHPPDIEVRPVLSGPTADDREDALARITDNWRFLAASDRPASACDGIRAFGGLSEQGGGGCTLGDLLREARETRARGALFEAGETAKRAQDVCDRAGTGGPAGLDEQMRSLIALEDEIERRLGRLLAEMGEGGAWSRLHFAGIGHYGEQRLGLSRTTAEDRAGLLRALRPLPVVREAYESGRIGFEAALLIRRVLDRRLFERRALDREGIMVEDQEAWVSRAEEVTVKRLRDEVRLLGRTRAMNESRASAPPPDDACWRDSIQRRGGTAMERVAVFGRAAAAGRSPDVFLRLRLPEELAGDFLAAIESRRRALSRLRETLAETEQRFDENSPGSVLAARTFSSRSGWIPAWVGLLALIEDYVETWDDPRQLPRRAADAVYIRDGWRCTAPGCTSRRHLEEHHVIYRSRGGSDDLSNRICLCRLHHQLGEHGGLASCRGKAPLGILWRLGRDGLGGWYRNERRLPEGG